MTAAARLIVGNLDFEDRLAPPDPAALGGKVRRSISALATVLRVFARTEDRLWTPEPVAANRLPGVPGLAAPELVHGPRGLPAPGAAVLAWGESEEVSRLRGERPLSAPVAVGAGLHDRVWRGPFSAAAAARGVGHRGFQLRTATALGVALPGATFVEDLPALRAYLATGGAAEAPEERWVLKAPFSAAGRERLRGMGRGPLAARDEARATRLFARHGALLFEPWMQREADHGAVGWIDAEGPRLLGIHRQDLDGYGRFRGLTVRASNPGLTGAAGELAPDEAEQLGTTTVMAARRMAEAGYVGPFGIDAWRYRDASGRRRFNPLGEINARMTFGLIVHALAGRLLDAGLHFETLTFRFGRTAPPSDGAIRTVPLLLPAADEPTAAWIELA